MAPGSGFLQRFYCGAESRPLRGREGAREGAGSAIGGFILVGVVRQVAQKDPCAGDGPGHFQGAGALSVICLVHPTTITW